MKLYYGGDVIHQQTTDDGIIEVVDHGDMRSLHFGTFPRQSSMLRSRPHYLELSYTQAMMACLLLMPRPERVLVVGLGGGSLVKFVLHHFPECHVDVVEYRQDVIDIAQQFFDVPSDVPNLTIHHDDARDWLLGNFLDDREGYDLLLVDAYDHAGMSSSLDAQHFFDLCAGALNESGVMSINLWGSDRVGFPKTMAYINTSFNNNSLLLPVPDKGNVIALSCRQPINTHALKGMQVQAETADRYYEVGLPRHLRHLQRQNRSFLSRLFG